MLDVLVASKPPHHAGVAELLTSSLLHAGLLSLALVTTHTAVQVAREIVSDTSLIYLPRLAPPTVDRQPAGGRRGGGGGGAGGGEGGLGHWGLLPAGPAGGRRSGQHAT